MDSTVSVAGSRLVVVHSVIKRNGRSTGATGKKLVNGHFLQLSVESAQHPENDWLKIQRGKTYVGSDRASLGLQLSVDLLQGSTSTIESAVGDVRRLSGSARVSIIISWERVSSVGVIVGGDLGDTKVSVHLLEVMHNTRVYGVIVLARKDEDFLPFVKTVNSSPYVACKVSEAINGTRGGKVSGRGLQLRDIDQLGNAHAGSKSIQDNALST